MPFKIFESADGRIKKIERLTAQNLREDGTVELGPETVTIEYLESGHKIVSSSGGNTLSIEYDTEGRVHSDNGPAVIDSAGVNDYYWQDCYLGFDDDAKKMWESLLAGDPKLLGQIEAQRERMPFIREPF